MNLKRITDRAKDVVEKRGGTESLKQDAAELKRIAQGEGTIKDKAKRAADALKDPGREGAPGPAEAAGADAPKGAPTPSPAAAGNGDQRTATAPLSEQPKHGAERR